MEDMLATRTVLVHGANEIGSAICHCQTGRPDTSMTRINEAFGK
ncbi:hypothetical protein [Cupriavidus basilensis]|nr:hypothetical protein [Cupriavidus basilensis]